MLGRIISVLSLLVLGLIDAFFLALILSVEFWRYAAVCIASALATYLLCTRALKQRRTKAGGIALLVGAVVLFPGAASVVLNPFF